MIVVYLCCVVACIMSVFIRYYCMFSQMFSVCIYSSVFCFFFQAEDGIRDLVRSRGLGDVYKRQVVLQPLDTLQ